MFRTPITESPLINSVADSMFSSIYGDSFNGDVSTVATLRCFFGKRLTEGENIYVSFSNSRHELSDIDNSTDEAVAKMLCARNNTLDPNGSKEFLWIHNITGTKEGAEAAIEKLRTGFPKVFLGYKENSGISALYKGMKLLCIYNEELRNVIVFVCSLNYKRLHYLQAAFLPMFPWYRRGENKNATEFDVELIKVLTQEDESVYKACVRKFADQFDFRAEKIKSGLAGFETMIDRQSLEESKRKVELYDVDIENLHRSIESKLSARYGELITIAGLEAKIARGTDGTSEIMEYFLCNKRLHFYSTSGSKLVFAVSDYLTYFDKEQAQVMFENPRSYFNTCGEKLNRLLKAILLDELVRVRFCAAFTLDITRTATAIKGENYSKYGICDCVPNPHLNHYSCLGNNERVINNLVRDHDYIGAIEQCVAACKNWNVLDSTVTSEFISDLRNNTYSCIELPDGRIVRPEDAIKWLEEKDKKNEEKEKEE